MSDYRFRYVIGDIQGCDAEFDALLKEIAFDPAQDQLWVAGDMINRGPGSLAVLRQLMALGERAVCVLGNHDIYFLAVVAGVVSPGEGDTLHELLAAPDLPELVDWLRRRPLLHVEERFVMVHAGLLPGWSLAQARSLAGEVEHVLSSADWQTCLHKLWGGKPVLWSEDLIGPDRLRIIVNAMCRMRFLYPDGSLALKPKGAPEAWPNLLPWYSLPLAQWRTHTVLHGHWSALGYRDMGGVVSLDTGCVWGGCLSAYRLEDRRLFQISGRPGLEPEGGD